MDRKKIILVGLVIVVVSSSIFGIGLYNMYREDHMRQTFKIWVGYKFQSPYGPYATHQVFNITALDFHSDSGWCWSDRTILGHMSNLFPLSWLRYGMEINYTFTVYPYVNYDEFESGDFSDRETTTRNMTYIVGESYATPISTTNGVCWLLFQSRTDYKNPVW